MLEAAVAVLLILTVESQEGLKLQDVAEGLLGGPDVFL